MPTIRNRRAATTQPAYRTDEDGDRLYTEDDYAISYTTDEWAQPTDVYGAPAWNGEDHLPDEAFEPDTEEEALWSPEQPTFYTPLFEGQLDFSVEEEDLPEEELLTEEEQAELRRNRWQLIAGLADFAGVILGTAAILILVALLVSLLNWLINDVSQSFILLQKNL